MPHTFVYGLEVDVAVRRPAYGRNIVTHGVVVAIEDQPSLTRADNEARRTAAYMCWNKGPVVTATRIIWAVL